jgi:carboxymethylenebutenolidase
MVESEEPRMQSGRPNISQEMIRLYDEYTHLTLDRRGFMEKLTKLAGSGAAAAALVPILSNDYAKAGWLPKTTIV